MIHQGGSALVRCLQAVCMYGEVPLLVLESSIVYERLLYSCQWNRGTLRSRSLARANVSASRAVTAQCLSPSRGRGLSPRACATDVAQQAQVPPSLRARLMSFVARLSPCTPSATMIPRTKGTMLKKEKERKRKEKKLLGHPCALWLRLSCLSPLDPPLRQALIFALYHPSVSFLNTEKRVPA